MNDPRRLARLEALALLVAQGMSLRAAAKRLGWAHRTTQKYAHMDEFPGRVREVQARIQDQAIGRLVRRQVRAADKLAKLMDGAEIPPAVQLAAAKLILRLPTDMKATRELAEFLRGLEDRQDGYDRRSKIPGGATGSANGSLRRDGPAG
jgi:hypothetical protein